MLKSILLGLPIAVIAIGAADNVDLPDALQSLISNLDIASHFPPQSIFGIQHHIFEYWTLPLNVVFYTSLLFLLFLIRGLRSEPRWVVVKGYAHRLLPAHPAPPPAGPPSAEVALDPAKLSRHLALLPIFQWSGALREVQVRVMKQGGKDRCTFEILLRSGLVGKVYAMDRQDIYEFMETLKRAGFCPDGEFSIPQPIAYLPGLRLLLQEKAEGMSAKEVFKYGDERQRLDAARRCGKWLARFHTVAPPCGQVLDREGFLRQCARRNIILDEEGGALASKAQQLLEIINATADSLAAVPLCAGHGDFGSFQIIFTQDGRVVVYDWDLFDTAEPTRDVARFVISLERQARSLGTAHALDCAVRAFLDAYLDAGGHPQVRDNLPFFKAAAYLRAASWKTKVKDDPSWRERAEVMLDEGLKALTRSVGC